MTSAREDKLRDYLSGLKELKNPLNFPMGAIVADKKDEILQYLKSVQCAIIEGDREVRLVWRDILDAIYDEEIIILNMSKELPNDLVDKIRFLKPKGNAKLVLLMDEMLYERSGSLEIITSVCRLTIEK